MKENSLADKRMARISTVAVAAMALFSLPGIASATWAETATHAFPMQGLKVAGNASAEMPVHVVLSLKLQNRSDFDQFFKHLTTYGDPRFGQVISRDTFISRYAPTMHGVQTVTDFLTRAGFSDVEVAPNRLMITATGTVGRAEAAFGTRIASVETTDHRTAIANTEAVRVPASLKDLVLSVLGLQTVAQAHADTEATTISGPTGVVPHAPAEFVSIYDATLTPTGAPYGIGIISAGSMTQTVADFKQFETQSGIPATPVSVIYSETPGATTGTQTWDIASQVAVGMAGQLKGLYFYSANSLLLTDIVTAFNRAVTDNVVPVINVSLGDCEIDAAETGFMATSDQIFQQGIAQGQTFFAASGNLGAHCDTDYKFKTSVEYPASSPYVTTVGGTTLTTTTRTDAYSSEAAWINSGGGISRYEPAPAWQAGYNKASYRGLPDMAMDGDPASGAKIVVNGSTAAYGGTSLSTALAIGAWSRVWAHFGDPTYFFSPLVYAYVPAFQSGAHDIVTGKNGPFPGFHARAGWDYVSGFGSWDVYADIYGTTP